MIYKQVSNEKLIDELSVKVIDDSITSEVFRIVSFHTCNTVHRPIERNIKRNIKSYIWSEL